ncbi:CD99 molecule isoform X2 [Brachyhypopomus gauderio]|uniref:CD99 molecule isoform X2 n=1 Tax=Brachyhypopomus gauderio TaxID=698409 RepID=UPI004042DCE4
MTSYLWIVLLACLAGAKAQGFDLSDALDSTPAAPKPGDKPKQGGDDSFDLNDALGPDPPNDPKQPAPGPPKPAAPNKPPSSGGGGFSDDDLGDVAGGEYNPDPGPGRRPSDNDYDSTGGDSGHTQDPNQLWLQLLRLLGDNVPEYLQAWTDNFRKVSGSLLETLMELLDSSEGEKQS